MKKIINIFIFLLCAIVLNAQQVDRSVRPSAAPAKEIQIKDAKSFTLSNGLKVFVVEDNTVPIVRYSLFLDIKPELEGDKAGLSDIFTSVIGTATAKQTKEELNRDIDLIAARISSYSRGGNASSLKKYEDKMLAVFSEILLQPVFNQSELDLNVKKYKSDLSAVSDDISTMNNRLASALAYGKGFPSGEIETEATYDNIKIEDLQKYYDTYFAPDVARLVIVGDVSEKEAKANAEKYFGKWARKNVPVTKYTIPQTPQETKVAMIDKPGSVQSAINITYPIQLPVGSPDENVVEVLMHVFGQGMGSRLFQNLRETHSYTYGVYSFLHGSELVSRFHLADGRSGAGKVKGAATDSAIYQIDYEMRKMIETPISEKELEGAKTYLAGNFGRMLENSGTLADFAVNIDKYNLPKDYYKNYLKRLYAVTPADIQAAAKKYLKPDNAFIVVTGDKSHAEGLKKFAANKTVQFYDVNANPVEAPETGKVDISAEQIIDNYVKALGGSAAIEQINDYSIKSEMSVMGQKIEINQLFKKPGMSVTDMIVGGASMQKIVFTGTKLIMSGMGGNQEFTEGAEFESAKAEASVCQEMDFVKNGCKMTVKGTDKIGESDVYVVDVECIPSKVATYFFDVKSGLLLKRSVSVEGPQGETQQVVEYADYKSVNEVLFAHTVTQKMMGMEMKAVITSITVNSGLSDDLFK
ncbi:MAG: insulinase family protein [Dysgonamonadaceae bacterium]|jgi:predicted Zn-dependent peptidase|nr:insulinase family protein [Dysgonamonadaceae bacterium]